MYEENRKYIEAEPEAVTNNPSSKEVATTKANVLQNSSESQDEPAINMTASDDPNTYKLLLRGPKVNVEIVLDNETNVGVAKMYIEMIEKKIKANESKE